MKARLVLEDGTCLTGDSFGAKGEAIGEVVFNTSMTGYQEVLTDPSYCGQLVIMTYPLIGNCGFFEQDDLDESSYLQGLIVREYVEYASDGQKKAALDQWLQEHKIIGIAGIDTRMLTRKIRRMGTLKGIITTEADTIEELQQRLQNTSIPNWVAKVSTKETVRFDNIGKRIVLVDFGAKRHIRQELQARHCEVIEVPYSTSAKEILGLKPDGVLLSNGPGNPKSVPEAVEMIQGLLGKTVIFGIGFGHQLLALACGADTEKLPFGHRGGNHPVKELDTGRVLITAQNHGYTVTKSSIEGTNLRITQLSLNDGTIEGLEHKEFPAFSIQYHPETKAGPWDSSYLFDRFLEKINLSSAKGDEVNAERSITE